MTNEEKPLAQDTLANASVEADTHEEHHDDPGSTYPVLADEPPPKVG